MLGLTLPPPYPDELVGSVLCRAAVHLGLSYKQMVPTILGTSQVTLSFFLPSALSRLASLMRKDAEQVLWQNTVFPYAVAFMPREEVERMKRKVLTNDGSLAALIQSATNGMTGLRYCPDCVSHDIQTFRESYWHRAHNLPACHVCLVHEQPLHVTSIDMAKSSRACAYGVPQYLSGAPSAPALEITLQHALASSSHRLCTAPQTAKQSHLEEYHRQAQTKGYEMKDGQIASSQVSHDLTQFYGEDYLDSLGVGMRSRVKGWPAMMVRPGTTVPFSPVKHVLLRTFLEQCPEGSKELAYRPPGKAPLDPATLDPQLAKMVRRARIRANQRLVTMTATKLMQSTGHWQAFRHKRSQFPLTEAELLAFRASEASERKLGGRAAHQRNMARKKASKL